MKRNIILLSFFIIFISGSIILKNQIESKRTKLTDLRDEQTDMHQKINRQQLFKENLDKVLELFNTNLVKNAGEANNLDEKLQFEKKLTDTLSDLDIKITEIRPKKHTDNIEGNIYKKYDLKLKCTFEQFAELIKNLEKDERIIVIDEAQDIFQEELLDSIFICLKDGADSGNWTIFIDRVYQGFYKGFDKDYFDLFIHTYSNNMLPLIINCRNHKDVIKMASTHSGLKEMPCRREKVMFKTKVESYDNINTLSNKLNELIDKLINDKIIAEQITVLTFTKEMISFIKSNSNHEIEEINEQKNYSNNKISISTIHGFKGLEADFVIIAGLEDVDIENNELMSLIFVGYSRAKMGLSILINDYALDSLISRKN